MMERPTPETDAAIIERRHIHKRDGSVQLIELIEAEASRKLERERDEAQIECLEQERLLGMSSEREAKLISERDEARKKYDNLATEHMLVVNKLCKERDDALSALGKTK